MLALRPIVRIGVVTALSAFGVIGCDDVAAPVPNAEATIAAARGIARHARPFRGRIRGTITAVPPFAPGSNAECNANFSGDPASPGASVSVFDEATGTFSHLGRSDLRAVSCVDPDSPFSFGEGTLTAANGDQLFIAFENLTVPDATDPSVLHTTGTQAVTGGTGRFQLAHGVQSCAFQIVLTSPSSGQIDGLCEGSLTY